MFISAIITAGGSGKRFGSSIKKQFLHLSGKPVLFRTIDNFYFNKKINEIILTLPADSMDIIKEIKRNYPKKPLTFVTGGKERQDSVYNALIKCNPNTHYVFIHDGVRPFLTNDEIEDLIIDVQKHKCVILAKKITDTIKYVEKGKIIRTVDRNPLYAALTPQVFDYNLIMNLHEKAKEQNLLFTDDAAICEHYQKEVFIMETKNINIKITKPADLILAEEIFRTRENKNED